VIYECHGHIILDGVAYTGSIARHKGKIDEDFIRHNLKTYTDLGITYYRDGGDKHGVSVYAKKIAGEYGIDYVTAAFIILKKGHYGIMFGRSFENLHEYRELVLEAIDLGADFIKTTASGLLDFANGGTVTHPSISLEELKEIVNIAHGEGMSVMIHANGADNIKRAAEAGVDSIEHGYYMDIAALKIMADRDVIWVPTCATSANLIGTGLYDDDMLVEIVENHKAAMIEASRIGVSIACGSDAGAAHVFQGSGTLDEMTILESIGIDPMDGNKKIYDRFRRK